MKKLLTVVIALLCAQAAWAQDRDPPATVEEMAREIWQATNEIRDLLLDLAPSAIYEALFTGNTLKLTSSEGQVSYVAFSANGRHSTHFPGDAGWPPGNYLLDTDMDTVTLRLTWDPANSHNEYLWDVALTFTSATEGSYASTYLEYGRESSTGSGGFEIVGVVETDPPAGKGAISADSVGPGDVSDLPPLMGEVVIDGTARPLDHWGDDPYELHTSGETAPVVEGDTLTLTLSYSGGCARHDFTLVADDALREADPVELDVFLAHDGNNDACEAYPTEAYEFDLTPVRTLHQETYGTDAGAVLLRFHGQDVPEDDPVVVYSLLYTFG